MQTEPLQYRRRKLMAEINVVPYIDVMLVLLIIFMVTAPLLQQGIKVDLPKTTTKPMPTINEEPIVLTVDAKGRYYLNIAEDSEKSVSLKQVAKTVAIVLRKKPDLPVLVRGDRKVDYGIVVNAMSVLQKAGAPNVGLITDLKK